MRRLFAISSGLGLPAACAIAGAAAVGLMTAFAPADAEVRGALARQHALDALALAQGGLERFIVERAALIHPGMPADEEHARVDGVAGFADVSLHRVRRAVDGQPALYTVRSRGTVPGEGGPLAQHEVAQLATWRAGRFAPPATWTTLRGQAPAAAGISGEDRCEMAPAMAPVAASAAFAGIDWRGIVDGTALVRGAAADPAGFERYSAAEAWPIIRVDGDHDLAGSGRGVLIVTGDLRIAGGREWRGLVLAGGRVEMRAGARIRGAVVTGLNERIGVRSAAGDVIDARARVRFDSCDVARAADAFGTLELVPGTWVDG